MRSATDATGSESCYKNNTALASECIIQSSNPLFDLTRSVSIYLG